jgi:hypothetical protein
MKISFSETYVYTFEGNTYTGKPISFGVNDITFRQGDKKITVNIADIKIQKELSTD